MAYLSTNDASFLSTARQWIEASGEILAIIRYHAMGGARSFEFFGSFDAFTARLRQCRPRTCIIVFRDRQLSLRGRVDANFIEQATEMMQVGQDFLITDLELTIIGAASWFENVVVETQEELLERLQDSDCYGKQVAFGPYPPWIEDNDGVISAIVPDEDGAILAGAY